MVHESKWWYVIPIAPRSKVMYNTFTNMEHMEDVASRKEDDVEHANVDDHDNEDERAISHDHEDDPTIEDDGDDDENDHGIDTIINGPNSDSRINLIVTLQIDQMDIDVDRLARMDLIEDEIEP